ncbi:MAG: phosphotransferase [Chitinophagales bacterium]
MSSSSMQEAKLRKILKGHPVLGAINQIIPLRGGLTNKNYILESEQGRFVARVGGASSSFLGIDRDRERINTKQAHAAGIGPAVVANIPEENILIISWIEAKTLHAADFLSDPHLLARVAETLRKLHQGPAFEGIFHFPALRKHYLDLVRNFGYFLPDDYLSFESQILDLEGWLSRQPEPLVPCNNDLLAENFLDDGKRIWIIDYEYSGQNEASFEIGNMSGELGLSGEQLRIFCDTYWRQYLPEKMIRARTWSIIARFGWVLWASIQEAVSPIDFDFRSWGLKKWQSVLPELSGDAYRQLIMALKKIYS